VILLDTDITTLWLVGHARVAEKLNGSG